MSAGPVYTCWWATEVSRSTACFGPKLKCLSTLPEDEKRAEWARIRREEPALAELLKQMEIDPFVQRLLTEFGGQILIEVKP